MPKTLVKYDAYITIPVVKEMKYEIQALSFMFNHSGHMAPALRSIYKDYLVSIKKKWKEESPEKLEQFYATLENVKKRSELEQPLTFAEQTEDETDDPSPRYEE
jgi:hypothetical protein